LYEKFFSGSQSLRAIAAILLVYLVIPTIAFAATEEIWTCTYPGFSQDRRPVIRRYRQQGEFLVVQDQWREEYRILQNNQFGIVASSSISKIETNQNKTEPSIGARTLIINKRTDEFLWSILYLDEPDRVNAPVHGACIRG
jgi:hypothetical protein